MEPSPWPFTGNIVQGLSGKDLVRTCCTYGALEPGHKPGSQRCLYTQRCFLNEAHAQHPPEKDVCTTSDKCI
jgi:hypothetical protein